MDYYRQLDKNNTLIKNDDNPCTEIIPDTSLINFRIASIFIIFACSIIGVLISLQNKHFKCFELSSYTLTIAKTFGTGILLSCALVHLLQPSNEALTSVCASYNFNTAYQSYAYVYCMISFLCMQFLQNHLNIIARKKEHSTHISNDITYDENENEVCEKCTDNIKPEMNIEAISISVETITNSYTTNKNKNKKNDNSYNNLISKYNLIPVLSFHEAIIAELVFNIHSIIIGITIGLSTNNQFEVLVISVSFHQFFEGIALGARLFSASFNSFFDLIFTLFFSLSCPIGIAIGISMISSDAININGESFLMTQGTLDGITSGLLLHIASSKLLIDFPRDCSAVNDTKIKLFWLYFAVSAGAGMMAYLGRYL